jgi:putative glycosyltransferase (TIGR04372 family)
MDARLINLEGQEVLVAQPRGHALGLLLGDLIVAVHVTREIGRSLLLLDRPETSSSPLLRLRYEGVDLLEVSSERSRQADRLLHRRSPSEWMADVTRPLRLVSLLAVQRVVASLSDFHRSAHPLSAAMLNKRLQKMLRLVTDLFNKGISILQYRGQSVLRGIAKLTGKSPKEARAWERSWKNRLQRYKRGKWEFVSVKGVIRSSGESIASRLEEVRMGRSAEGAVHEGHDLRFYAAMRPLRGRLAPSDDATAREAAERAGLDLNRPLVTLHVRESRAVGGDDTEARGKDIIRNARIESYGQAIGALVRRGAQVVRIGDGSMPQIRQEGVIDLATYPNHTALLDFWCVANSQFFVASDSGPYLLSWLFDVPCLSVNIVNILGVYPLRACDRYIIKRVRHIATGRALSLSEMLSEDFVYGFRRRLLKVKDIELIDNTSDEITAAVEEMSDALEYPQQPTSGQKRFRDLVFGARAGAISRSKLRGKVGREATYLGDGWVADSFVRTYLES